MVDPTTESPPRQLLTVRSVAARLDTSPEQVRQKLREGELEGIKLGHDWRVYADAVEALLQQRRKPDQLTRVPIDEKIRRIVSAAPPLTDDQIDNIVAIIRADRSTA